MEILLLVLLLMNAKGEQSDLKQTLNSVLSFYRENRELIAMLLNATKTQQPSSEERPKEENSRPQDTQSADSSMIEELLKKQF